MFTLILYLLKHSRFKIHNILFTYIFFYHVKVPSLEGFFNLSLSSKKIFLRLHLLLDLYVTNCVDKNFKLKNKNKFFIKLIGKANYENGMNSVDLKKKKTLNSFCFYFICCKILNLFILFLTLFEFAEPLPMAIPNCYIISVHTTDGFPSSSLSPPLPPPLGVNP